MTSPSPLSWPLLNFIWQKSRIHDDASTLSPASISPAPSSSRTSLSSFDDERGALRPIIVDYLSRIQVPFPTIPYDLDFDAACCDEITRRGYHLKPLKPFLPGGVVMATTSYAHLDDMSTRIFIALYTGYLIYLDDVFGHDVSAVEVFNERFMMHQKQKNPVLDDFADLLYNVSEHWPNRVVSNLIVTSTLNLVNALLLESETQEMRLQNSSHGYPTFSRVMSGASEAYGLFIFPSHLPLPSHIQALPELMVFINNGNDILSFYKEEAAGETVNRVSWLAECHRISKTQALKDLVEEAIEKRKRILEILAPCKEAREAFLHFSRGYVGFHAGLKRYRLSELDL